MKVSYVPCAVACRGLTHTVSERSYFDDPGCNVGSAQDGLVKVDLDDPGLHVEVCPDGFVKVLPGRRGRHVEVCSGRFR